MIGTIIIATFSLRLISSLFQEEAEAMTTRATPAEASDARAGRPSPAPVPPGRRRKKVEDTSEGLRGGPVWALIAWALTFLFFLPVAWMVLTSFHQEVDAAQNRPRCSHR